VGQVFSIGHVQLNNTNMRQSRYHHCGFFVLRSPLLAYGRLTEFFGHDPEVPAHDTIPVNDHEYMSRKEVSGLALLGLLDDPAIKEALWLASPGLVGRLSDETFVRGGSRYAETLTTLYKYLLRMTTRCTPFGLFASCTYGRIAEQTQFDIANSVVLNRVTRLDVAYLYSLVSTLNADKSLRKYFRYRQNSSIYSVGERVHYAEARVLPEKRGVSYKLSAAESTDYLLTTLTRAESPVTAGALAEALCVDDADISMEEASGYVDELIDSQLLVPELTPFVTGISPLAGIVSELNAATELQSMAAILGTVHSALNDIDSSGIGIDTRRYLGITEELKRLPADVGEKHLFQVDMNLQFPIQLGEKLTAEILVGAELLHAISPQRQDLALDRFRREFRERYEEQQIPLHEALDEDIGIGFDGSSDSAFLIEPLLSDIPVFRTANEGSLTISAHELQLMDRVQKVAREAKCELQLDTEMVESLKRRNIKPLPDAWSAFVSLYGTCDGSSEDYRFLLKSVSGPGGANLLGRFCHLNMELKNAVRSSLQTEESLNPDTIYAEIAHMPEGRVGNVLQRPLLREHEIAYLGKSGAAEDRKMTVRDILVSVKGEQIILRSKRDGRQILPRLASAHNYANPANLRIYRFLCLLQHQGVQGALFWSWGPLNNLDFLPRVTHGRMILSPASWRLRGEDVKSLLRHKGFAQFELLQELRGRLMLPRMVLIAESDNDIPFDLSDPLSVQVFCDWLAKYKMGLRVEEMLSAQFELPLKVKGKAYVNELLIPFVRRPG
jgi:lantibiotic biosynthesis protein